MPYDEIAPKQKRIIERDLETLFSVRAFVSNPSLEDLKNLTPTVRCGANHLLLSDIGVTALQRLTELIGKVTLIADSVSERELNAQILRSYEDWLSRDRPPTGQEFMEDITGKLLAIVKDYEFLILVEGIDLRDQDVLQLGSVRIQRSDRSILESIKFEGCLNLHPIYEQFKDNLWLIGLSKGSPDIALERFELRVMFAIGTLAVCGALFYKGAIWRTRMREVGLPAERRVISLRWEKEGQNPAYSHKLAREQDLPLGSDSTSYLIDQCFMNQLASLPDKTDRTELEDAILRSLYWFADAHQDRNPTMQFIKLWSCAECFFSVAESGETECKHITKLNAKGIAAVLAFAGYQVISPQDYQAFKRRITQLYKSRSQALHRAKFGHLKEKDLNDFSYWIAWIIISMVALSERGYETLRQIHEQTSRLDDIAPNGPSMGRNVNCGL